MKAVIFDLDGTLVDSAPDIVHAANALLRARGRPGLEYDQVRSFIGNGVPKLVERVMEASGVENTPARFADWVDGFVGIYAQNPIGHTKVYPGVVDLLTHLQGSNIALGVCTNKNHALTLPVLDGLGLGGFFGSVIGGDTLPVKKPDPAPLMKCMEELNATDVVYVGDSEVDAATAVAARRPFALFTEGYRKSPVALIPHQVSFSDFGNAAAQIETLFQSGKLARA